MGAQNQRDKNMLHWPIKLTWPNNLPCFLLDLTEQQARVVVLSALYVQVTGYDVFGEQASFATLNVNSLTFYPEKEHPCVVLVQK